MRRRRWHRKRFPLEGKFDSLFMLGAGAKAKAVHVKTEQARDWSVAIPLRSLGTHGALEVRCCWPCLPFPLPHPEGDRGAPCAP